jgi:hypothetical protein
MAPTTTRLVLMVCPSQKADAGGGRGGKRRERKLPFGRSIDRFELASRSRIFARFLAVGFLLTQVDCVREVEEEVGRGEAT